MIRGFIKIFSRAVLMIALATMMATAPVAVAQNAAFKTIESLEFHDSTVGEAIRLISRLSGVNIFATSEAAGKKFSMSVNDTTVKGVVASIARVSGLSYSYDSESNAFILMTNGQFADDVVITRNAETKVFTIRHQNVVSAARVIESLFGDRVSLNTDTADPERLEISEGGTQNSRTLSNEQRSTRVTNSASSGDSNRDGVPDPNDLESRRLRGMIEEGVAGRVIGMDEVAKRFGLEPNIYVTINREHNLLYVRTTDRDAMRDITRIIRETDRPTKQVLLEVRVMSLDLSDTSSSVFDFGLTNDVESESASPANSAAASARGFSGTGSGGNLFFQFISDNLLAQINLLEQQNRAKTISTPMLSASNNSPARLFVGAEAVLARGFSSLTSVGSSGQSTTRTTADVELREVGQSLQILPRINADDTVTLVIEQEHSSVVKGGGSLPVVSNTGTVRQVSVDTVKTARVGGTVTAKTGTTIAVGGLINQSSSSGSKKVPVLGNIPLLGLMFRGDNKKEERSELILLITPHIYSGGVEGERKARARLARISRNSDLDTAGFTASSGGVPKVKLRGQQQQYAALTRFAAAMRHGIKPADRGAYRNIDSVAVQSGGGLKYTDVSEVTVEVYESWRKQNLYVTAVVLTNTGKQPCQIRLNRLQGDWLAATAETENLAAHGKPGSRSYVYLISDRPFDSVIANLRAGSGI